MEFTQSLVQSDAERYETNQPFSEVEAEHREILPEMLLEQDVGKRDVEWVVQWYFRRYLGAYPDSERRELEQAFGDNDFGSVLETLELVTEAPSLEKKIDRLTALDGVSVPVASAFLFFMYPDEYLVMGDWEWELLHEACYLEQPYPDEPSIDSYLEYHEITTNLCADVDVDRWTLYRFLWQRASERR